MVSILKKNDAEATLHGIATIEDTEDMVSAIVFGLGAGRHPRCVGHPCPFCPVKVLGMYE